MKKLISLMVCCLIFVLLLPEMVLADKSAVSIEAPATVTKGGEALIRLTVTHNSNSFFHYTNWVRIDVDGKTIERWEYTKTGRPEAAVFKKEVRLRVPATMELTAEANCNLHGSAGPTKTVIRVQD